MAPDENFFAAKKILSLKIDSGEEPKSQDESKNPAPIKSRSLKVFKKAKGNPNVIAKLKGAVKLIKNAKSFSNELYKTLKLGNAKANNVETD